MVLLQLKCGLANQIADSLDKWRASSLEPSIRDFLSLWPIIFLWVKIYWFKAERNRIAFENEELLIHGMKNSFICNFWSWTKPFIDEGPLPLINFFYWLGSRWGLVSFLYPFFFLFLPLGVSCLLLVCFRLPFRRLFLLIYFFCDYLSK